MTSSSYKRGARPRPKVPTRVSIGPLPQVFQVALRWTAAWAVVGLVLGILLMLGKAPPFAESGTKPDSIFGYIFWVPALGGGAAAAGLGIGLLFAGLMTLITEWRESLEDTPGAMAKLGPEVACGAVAGLIAGLLVGGFTGALFFGTMGAGSAGVMKHLAIRKDG
jgi:hypothetical protein